MMVFFGDKNRDMSDKNINSFVMTYSGPSFENGTSDLSLLSEQLTALKNLLDEEIKNNNLENFQIKKEISFKKGSLVETIILLSENRMVASSVSAVISAVISGLVQYKTNKNMGEKRLPNHASIVNQINVKGDYIQVNGGNNSFFLHHKDKEKYLKNLEPKQVDNVEIKQKKLIGKFRMIDLNKSKNQLGFDTGKEKGIPTTFKNAKENLISVFSKTVDKKIQITANVVYKNGSIKSIEILSYDFINKELNFDNT